jgi:hypothetical protein
MRKVIFFLLVLGFSLSLNGFAQSPSPVQVNKKVPITGNENFDFLFTRSAMLGKNKLGYDAARTGSTTFGVGFGIPLDTTLLLKFEPRFTWTKMYYGSSSADSLFPGTDSTGRLISQRQRISYFEVPVSFKFKLARNLVDRYKLLVEAGFVIGVRVGSTYKTKLLADSTSFSNALVRPRVTNKVNHIDDLNLLRYGPFLRIGTNWLSVYGFYRMSDIFRTDKQFPASNGQKFAYPQFPRLEVGLTIAI